MLIIILNSTHLSSYNIYNTNNTIFNINTINYNKNDNIYNKNNTIFYINTFNYNKNNNIYNTNSSIFYINTFNYNKKIFIIQIIIFLHMATQQPDR